jgi:hypothetical protein
VLCFASCEDCYYVENDLHGLWQVTSVERFSTGEITEAQGELYYSFQRTMVMLSDVDLDVPNKLKRYIAHFDLLASDSIGMGDFRKRTTGEGNFVNQEEEIPLDSLHKFGFYQDYTTFHMERSKQKLVLTSDSACIVLRKY